jgi:hypothetical protein
MWLSGYGILLLNGHLKIFVAESLGYGVRQRNRNRVGERIREGGRRGSGRVEWEE